MLETSPFGAYRLISGVFFLGGTNLYPDLHNRPPKLEKIAQRSGSERRQ